MLKLFISIFSIILSFSAYTYTKDRTYSITILHTNDHHGRFWPNKDGQLGLAARATIIEKIRNEVQQQKGFVLLLDAGDVNTGVPQSDLQKAEPDFKGMKLLGYDVMAVGNHEFDNPVEVIRQQQQWAGFPFISANIYDQQGNRLFHSHIEKKFDDLSLTIMGLTTEDTPLKSKKENSQGLKFVPVIEEAKKIVPKLKSNTDVLIALTHMGHYPDEKHGSDAPGDVTLARQVTGIDLIVGGHTQKALFEPDIQNGTIIVQAEEWGKYVGRVDLEFLNGKITLKKYELIPVNYNTEIVVEQNPEVENFLRPFKEKGDGELLIPLAKSDIEFQGQRAVVRMQETNLGNLLAEVYRQKFNADLAVLNSGGIRDSIYSGVVTYESVLMVLPFSNEVVMTKMKGIDLKKYLKAVILNGNPGSGSYPQFSQVTATVDRSKNKVTQIKVGGKYINLNKVYTIALPEFVASGGDKYPVTEFQKFGFIDAEILKDFLIQKKHLTVDDFKATGILTEISVQPSPSK